LIRVHFNAIWPDLSEALLSEGDSFLKYFGLKHILGSQIGGIGREIGVLFFGDIDVMFDWCSKNRPLAPSRLAELVPIFDNGNTNYGEWHPVAIRILNEFGGLQEVLSSLGSNMGSFSWTGSAVPFLEAKLQLFFKLEEHPIELVRSWAVANQGYLREEIERERNRDAELFS